MNREELREQMHAAASRFTDELVEYFGEMLQSVVKDVTLGVTDVKHVRTMDPVAPRNKAEPKTASNEVAKHVRAPKKAESKNVNVVHTRQTTVISEPQRGAAREAKTATKSVRRSNKQLDQAAAQVVKLLKDEGRGLRIEEINKRLGTSTRELMRPIKKLLDSKTIQRRGERRSTTYFI